MIINIAILVIFGLVFNYLFSKLRIPGLLGMLALGVLCGPFVLNIIDAELLKESAELRNVALIVILLRAGLELRKDTLYKIGKTAFIFSTFPAILETLFIMFVAVHFLNLSYMEGAILGCVISAISPAVVVPLMLQLIDRKVGEVKAIPSMIVTGSVINDVFVIVIFTGLVGLAAGKDQSILMNLLKVPENIIIGALVGVIIGLILCYVFVKFNPRATKMAITVLSISIILLWLEKDVLKGFITFSALIASISLGIVLLEKVEKKANEISSKLSKIWVLAEIILFVLVGAQVNLHIVWKAGMIGAVIILIGLIGRGIGTYLSVLGTNYNLKEKIFCIIAYVPKATVQAALGSIPLEMGLPGGEIILAICVLSIIITAPIGAIGIELTADKLLETENAI